MKKSRTLILIALIALLVSISLAAAASNEVPVTGLGDTTVAKNANQFAPPKCAGMSLTNIVMIGNGNPTDSNDLILGTSSVDTIRAGDGNDCILGGSGSDILYGQGGDDVIIGGPGFDICWGILGSNQFYECELIF